MAIDMAALTLMLSVKGPLTTLYFAAKLSLNKQNLTDQQ